MSARTQGQEYDALVELGPATIPLVVRKLAEPDEFFAVGLCESDLIIPYRLSAEQMTIDNSLEKDEGVKVNPENIMDYHWLQRHAQLILEMNHQRNLTFASTVARWREYQQENQLSSNSAHYTSGNAYASLVQMGQGIIGNVMDQYANEQDGWWHEMLHEIVHGRRSGAHQFSKHLLYADWKEWFEGGEPLDAAPKSG